MDSLRSALASVRDLLDWLPDSVVAVLIIALAILFAAALHKWVRKMVRRLLAARYPELFSNFTQLRGLTRLALFILAMIIAVPVAPLAPEVAFWFSRLLVIAIVVLIGWSAITALHITADFYLRRFHIDTADNLLARKHVTQIQVLLRACDVLLVIFTIGGALMTFEPVRQYGYSLFASAGVAGIVAGLAARPVLTNLLAGVQLAVTQPIRIGDSVIVENESGTIEDITSTYVVVRIWDWRRMIVPLGYFIEKPFQNWTRIGNELIGTVFLYVDHTAPVETIRKKLAEIAAQSKLWNGKVVSLQVSDCKETTIEQRALVSANNAAAVWDLRCEVREKLIDFLQREHPEALPRRRYEAADVITMQPQEAPEIRAARRR